MCLCLCDCAQAAARAAAYWRDPPPPLAFLLPAAAAALLGAGAGLALRPRGSALAARLGALPALPLSPLGVEARLGGIMSALPGSGRLGLWRLLGRDKSVPRPGGGCRFLFLIGRTVKFLFLTPPVKNSIYWCHVVSDRRTGQDE